LDGLLYAGLRRRRQVLAFVALVAGVMQESGDRYGDWLRVAGQCHIPLELIERFSVGKVFGLVLAEQAVKFAKARRLQVGTKNKNRQ
jgi:hypothetical protein